MLIAGLGLLFSIYPGFPTHCVAKTISVGDGGFADFDNIQSAIESANEGDVIEVSPGLYEEDIHFLGKNITLTSINPMDFGIVTSTSIGYNGGHIVFAGTEGPNCVLSGFTINSVIYGMDGSYTPEPQVHTRATIAHCIIQGNRESCGTAIYGCDGLISNCLIADNNALACLCICPAIDACHGLIKNCTIVDGTYSVEVGVMNGGTTTVENCILYHHRSTTLPQILVARDATLNISHTFLQDDLATVEGTVNWGPGNVVGTDPRFIRLGFWDFNEVLTFIEGDYRLRPDSLCINTGDPNYAAQPNETDLDGKSRVFEGRIDMGAYEYAPPIEAQLRITPQTLDCTSKGKWIKLHITLPKGILPDDVDTAKQVQFAMPCGQTIVATVPYDKVTGGKGRTKLEVDFERQFFCCEILNCEQCDPYELVQRYCDLSVSGSLTNGQHFSATGTFEVIYCD